MAGAIMFLIFLVAILVTLFLIMKNTVDSCIRDCHSIGKSIDNIANIARELAEEKRRAMTPMIGKLEE